MVQLIVCDCGRPIRQAKTGPRRTKCDQCKPPRNLPKVVSLPIGHVEQGKIADTIRNALNAVGRTETPDGAVALHLAALLDQGGHTGPSAASLAREIRAAVKDALADAPEAGDMLDELKSRRAT